MNENSYLSRYIRDNPDTWEEDLKERKIRVKKEEGSSLVILSYGPETDFSDPLVQEARGIILDLDTLDVVCWPFRKFGNWQEFYADEIDFGTAVMQDKIDGSIIKLWFDKGRGKWQFSTNGCIRADETFISESTKTWTDVIKETDEWVPLSREIRKGTLCKEMTYIFELTGPEVQIVVRYDKPKLWHIGTRSNETGQEYFPRRTLPFMPHPDEWRVSSIDECVKAAEALNAGYEKDGVTKEGFVVVDRQFRRVKVKSPAYILMHYAFDGGRISKRRIVSIARNGISFDELSKTYPAAKEVFAGYEAETERLLVEARLVCEKTDAWNEEFPGDRKAVAGELKKEPLNWIAFRHLTSGESAEDILSGLDDSHYMKFLEILKEEEK